MFNGENKQLSERINFTFATYKNGGIDQDELIRQARILKEGLNTRQTSAETDLKMKRNPRTYGVHNSNYQFGENEKTRAYLLFDKNIGLIQSELNKEYHAGNIDFCITLTELVYGSDRSEVEKSKLNNFYHTLKTEKGIFAAENELRQIKTLQRQLDAIIDLQGQPDYVKAASDQIMYSEIELARSLDKSATPEHQKFQSKP